MRITYKQKLTLYFLAIFALFTMGIIIVEQSRERGFKTEALEEKLDAYTGIIKAALKEYPDSLPEVESLSGLLPENLRITLIDRDGYVAYDNAVGGIVAENHLKRPEIAIAMAKGSGSNIRTSATNNRKYLYYAKQSGNYFIRVALPYDIQVQRFLQPDNLFLYYIVLLFVGALFLIRYAANRFATSIGRLKEFALTGGSDQNGTDIKFPEDELGVIGEKIIENYRQIRNREKELILEREKLLQHVHSSGEGLCFFSPDRRVGLYNGLFIQYLNIITDESSSDPAVVFTDASFGGIVGFLSTAEQNGNYYHETQIGKHGKHFNIRINIFEDRSFEIIINDVSQQEKTRLLKQEMTTNIAHELRTPVTSIRGYLEIAIEQSLNKKQTHSFLAKAHEQTIVLSELIQDMSLITKIEEASASFPKEEVSIEELLENLKEELSEPLAEKNMVFEWGNMEHVIVPGNRNLLYSIFRNLTDNAIRYAGTNVTVTVNKYNEDKDFYYLSFADNGIGIKDEHHLSRLFERFYRVNEGRTRDTGGSGLGLSIVKNAILFHKGTIVVKNRTGGGLEFLFKLPKTS